MEKVTFQGGEVQLSGSLPQIGSKAPDFVLTTSELKDVKLADFSGKRVVLNIFPSIDTPVCAASVKRFNQEMAALQDVVVCCVSMDLPFAQGRFCVAEGIDQVHTLSAFRSPSFGDDYGIRIADTALAGLLARGVVVIDAQGQVSYTQLVDEIADEPDYESVLAHLKG